MKTSISAMVLGASLFLAGCADRAGAEISYANSDLELTSGYAASEVCSCVFVMEQDEDFCRAWTKASPAVVTFKVDRKNKRVEASAGLMWGAKARFVDEKTGCVRE